jgi:hypothetical protein
MKKIFTLLFFVGAFATSFAQKGHDKNDQYAVNKSNSDYRKFDNHRDKIYTFSAKEKNQEIARINQQFTFKIKSIKNNPFISRSKKKDLIKKMKLEKAQQIEAVNAKFNSKYNSANSFYGKKFGSHKH